MQENHPTSGGSWLRDPVTGALTQVEEGTRWEPKPETETAPADTALSLPAPVSEPVAPTVSVPETAAAEPIDVSEAAPSDAPAPTGRKVR